MNGSYTFLSPCGRLQFVVKDTFLQSCPNPAAHDKYDLFTKFKLASFLHNFSGPAITHLKTGKIEFWLDGKPLSEEESKKMLHDYNFGNKINDKLNEE